MKTYRRTSWHTWIAAGDIVLAVVFGFFVFFLLNVLSLGLLITLGTLGVFFLALGLVHYFVWGRDLTTPSARVRQAAAQDQATICDLFVFELNESERLELLSLLEKSLPSRDGEPNVDSRSLALRRSLADKLRMFGA